MSGSIDRHDQLHSDVIEARAFADAIAALVSDGNGDVQISHYQLLVLMQPLRERLARIEQSMNAPAIKLAG